MIERSQCEIEALGIVRQALDAAFRGPEPAFTASTDAAVQRALHLMRSGTCDTGSRKRVEDISTSLFHLAHARRRGRSNLYASRLLRLKRIAASTL